VGCTQDRLFFAKIEIGTRHADEMERSRLCALHPTLAAIESSARRVDRRDLMKRPSLTLARSGRGVSETGTSKFPHNRIHRASSRDELSILLPRNARASDDSFLFSELSITFRERRDPDGELGTRQVIKASRGERTTGTAQSQLLEQVARESSRRRRRRRGRRCPDERNMKIEGSRIGRKRLSST